MVVGGASGLGRASAERLVAEGAVVTILDRDESDGASVAVEVGAAFQTCDITDSEGVEAALAAANEDMGGLHIAINTAGGGLAARTLRRDGPHDLDEFRRIVELNLIGTFDLNRWQAWYMSTQDPDDGERGVIINTSSIAAFEGQIGQVAYSASKAAIAGMALTMARDLGSLGVRVAAIAPSLFATGAIADKSEDWMEPRVRDNAFPKRMGRPSEYAELALAIIRNPMLNGQCLRLDAGVRFGPR